MRWLSPRLKGVPESVGLLLVRLVVGVAFILHGWPKVKQPFSWMEGMGASVTPPGFLQAVGAFIEVGGGLLLILGLLTPLAALALALQMIAALSLVHWPAGHPFVAAGGSSYELPLVYLLLFVLFMTTGAGRFSLDEVFFGHRRAHRELVRPEPPPPAAPA